MKSSFSKLHKVGAVALTKNGFKIFHLGRPVEGAFGKGCKQTAFAVCIDGDMLSIEVDRKSRTPFYGDVVDAIVEATAGYRPERGNIDVVENSVGMKYFRMRTHTGTYFMTPDWNDKLSFRGADAMPASVARALALRVLKEYAE